MVNDTEDHKNKLWSKVARRVVILIVLAILIMQVARLWGYFNSGADQSEILFNSIQQIKKTPSVVKWAEIQPEGAFLDDYSRNLIGERYGEAWQAWNNALYMHNTEFLQDYFVDTLASRLSNVNRQIEIKRAVLTHQIVPVLYSVDKQLITFVDHQTEVVRDVYRQGELITTTRDSSTYLGVMTLDEGRWMVRHLKKIELPEFSKDSKLSVGTKEVSPDNLAEIESPKKRLFSKGINYYPQYSPWSGFWESYNPDTIRRDFDLITELGFDAVRFFIPYYDSRDAEVAKTMTENISSFLSIADAAGLSVMPTLFDFPKSFETGDYPAFNHYLIQVLDIIEEFSHMALVDVKNEPDLDMEAYGSQKVLRWLDFVIGQSNKHFPNLPLTIGWSDPSMADLLNDRLDVVSFHYYKDIEEYGDALVKLKSSIPEGKQIFLTEFGRSTFDPLWYPIGHSPEDQEAYISSILKVSSTSGIPTFLWCLYDYPKLPEEVFGWKPWIIGSQSQFGIVDKKGLRKPAAALFLE